MIPFRGTVEKSAHVSSGYDKFTRAARFIDLARKRGGHVPGSSGDTTELSHALDGDADETGEYSVVRQEHVAARGDGRCKVNRVRRFEPISCPNLGGEVEDGAGKTNDLSDSTGEEIVVIP
jgi:hypothetical protein